jgi:hypothetical protein
MVSLSSSEVSCRSSLAMALMMASCTLPFDACCFPFLPRAHYRCCALAPNMFWLGVAATKAYVAVSTQSGDLTLYNAQSAALVRTFPGPAVPRGLRFSQDGLSLLVGAAGTGAITRWRVSDGGALGDVGTAHAVDLEECHQGGSVALLALDAAGGRVRAVCHCHTPRLTSDRVPRHRMHSHHAFPAARGPLAVFASPDPL